MVPSKACVAFCFAADTHQRWGKKLSQAPEATSFYSLLESLYRLIHNKPDNTPNCQSILSLGGCSCGETPGSCLSIFRYRGTAGNSKTWPELLVHLPSCAGNDTSPYSSILFATFILSLPFPSILFKSGSPCENHCHHFALLITDNSD